MGAKGNAAENLSLWDGYAKTDMAFTKPREKPYPHRDIDATYMFRQATAAFGPLGQGWGYTLDKLEWLDNGMVVVVLSLWHSWGGQQSAPVQVIGSKIAEYDTSGEHSRHIIDDEAPKKATSDAIKKWLSMLGFSWDIFSGQHDDDHEGNGKEVGRGGGRQHPPSGGGPAASGSEDAAKYGPAGNCTECGKTMRLKRRKSDGKPFWSCSGYPECKKAFDAFEQAPAGGGPKDELDPADIPF